MPEEDKKTVDIDTSGPEVDIDIEEKKDESVVETEAPKQETESTEQETVTQEPEKKEDEKLEDYSKGVQARISKLTRKMREAERREKAALDYARGVEESRKALEKRFEKTESAYVKKFETSIKSNKKSSPSSVLA